MKAVPAKKRVPAPNRMTVSRASQAQYRAASPDRQCSMERCFDLSRCSSNGRDPPSLFIYPEKPPSKDMVRALSLLSLALTSASGCFKFVSDFSPACSPAFTSTQYF
eukprot:3346000-Pleurochrysis_carterae.AAC.2